MVFEAFPSGGSGLGVELVRVPVQGVWVFDSTVAPVQDCLARHELVGGCFSRRSEDLNDFSISVNLQNARPAVGRSSGHVAELLPVDEAEVVEPVVCDVSV